ncbi:hypothetical protein P154DRAFT_520535, partial [Amniculicola lignicola CBS 123094]
MRQLSIHPPLLNSSNPWCSNLDQLRELYACPFTGAVSTRTSLLTGFLNDSSIHQYAFLNPRKEEAIGYMNSRPENQFGGIV